MTVERRRENVHITMNPPQDVPSSAPTAHAQSSVAKRQRELVIASLLAQPDRSDEGARR
jgi:hypothetical protein